MKRLAIVNTKMPRFQQDQNKLGIVNKPDNLMEQAVYEEERKDQALSDVRKLEEEYEHENFKIKEVTVTEVEDDE
jgi:hypothetical protein